jgi:hypothetical protein
MTLYQFLQLDEMEQAEALWKSIMIADRIEGEYRLILYQRDSFYLEVWYHMEDNDIRGSLTCTAYHYSASAKFSF